MMLLRTILFVVFFGFSLCLNAQDFYSRFFSGYKFGLSKSDIGKDISAVQSGINTERLLEGGFGTGPSLGMALGVCIEENFCFELAYSFVASPERLTERRNQQNYSFRNEAKARQHTFLPALMLRIPFKDFFPYTRIGLIVPVSTKIIEDVQVSGLLDDEHSYCLEQTEVVNMKFNLGFYASAGIQYPINKMLDAFAEISIFSLSQKAHHSEITEYLNRQQTNDGGELRHLNNLSISEKEFEYVDEINSSSNHPDNPDYNYNEPTEFLSYNRSFSAFSIQLGLVYKLDLKKLLDL